jgi:ABC-type multidrug transport system fused ATPase/permease subunit
MGKVNIMTQGKIRKLYIISVITGSISDGLAVLFAMSLKYLTDTISNKQKDLFFLTLELTIVLILAQLLFGIISRKYLEYYAIAEIKEKKSIYYRYVLNSQGKQNVDMTKFTSDIEIMYLNYYINKASIIRSVVAFVISIIMALWISIPITLVLFIVSYSPFLIGIIMKKKIRNTTKDYSSMSDAYFDFIKDSTDGLDEIKNYECERIFENKHLSLNAKVEDRRLKNKVLFEGQTIQPELQTHREEDH